MTARRPLLAAMSIAAVFSTGCGGDESLPSSGLDLAALDRTADPCVDFYQFACGGWIASHPLDEDAVVKNRFQDPFYAAVPELRKIVEGDAAGDVSADDPEARRIGDYYASC